MERIIVGFHQDEEQHWVAELSCGHNQHTRHNPPLIERNWVLSEEGRQAHLGTVLNCVRCDEREIPDLAQAIRTTDVFSEATMPEAMRRSHCSGAGIWGRISVISGSLRYYVFEPYDEEQQVDAGQAAIIIPEVAHRLEPNGPVEFRVEFFKVGRKGERKPGGN